MALTYQQDLKIQTNKLKRALFQSYDKIKRDVSLDHSIGIYEIQYLHRLEIEGIIRSAVFELYTIAARKTVQSDIGLNSFFITQQDMQQINDLAQRYQTWFWTGLNREIVHQITAYSYDPKTGLIIQRPSSEFELRNTFIGRLVGSIQSEITSTAVVSKSRQIVGSNQSNGFINDRYINSLSRGSKIFTARRRAIYSHPQIIWTTGGTESTCPVCSQFEGQSFEISDLAMPMPVINTHPNCECELVLVGV